VTRKCSAGLARIALSGILVLGIVAGGALAMLWPSQMVALCNGICDAVRGSGNGGVALFAISQILVALSGVLPAALLGSAAGAIYGVGFGFVVAAVSTLLGAQLSYLASRTLLRGFAERALAARPRLRNLDEMIAKEGWRFVCLLRISPVMPFSATSYALGLSSVSARDYLIGTLAALPALFGYVVLGSLAQSSLAATSAGAGPFRLGLIAIGVVATLVLTLRLGQIARKVGLFRSKPRVLTASV
jgi:uncharacterized membrane protein YdjX (TVP38/TMEM64 family)